MIKIYRYFVIVLNKQAFFVNLSDAATAATVVVTFEFELLFDV